MNKARLEAFSDGVFSIVMTLLVFDIKLPSLPTPVTDAELWHAIASVGPHIAVYFVSFAVLSVIWINHHFLFHTFAQTVDRRLNLLNLAYLMFVAFVPFSAYLIGTYHTHQPAAVIYGANIFVIVALAISMIAYMRRAGLLSDEVTSRVQKQAQIRSYLSLICYLFGIIASFVSVPLSLFFYAFPTIFNIIPGTLDLTERMLGIEIV